MAKTKKEEKVFDADIFCADVITSLNEDAGREISFDLGMSEDPAKIKRWISTGSKLLDGICSGRIYGGGVPAGRFVEISGPESIGKSHIAYQVARCIQQSGGITNYGDTELASSVDNLRALGINVEKRFIYSKPKTIEEVFENCSSFLKKAELIPKNKRDDIPLAYIWDSVGGVGSGAEEIMSMDDNQRPGHNARIITLGLRKVKNSIDRTDCLFLIVNQIYDIINAGMYDKKTQTKGGKGLKYDCSIRIELQAKGFVYPNEIDNKEAYTKNIPPIGIKIKATTVKNKVASPFRSVEFEIHFGVGIKEHMTIWKWLVDAGETKTKNGIVKVTNNGAWKEIGLFDPGTGEEILTTGKFRKKQTEEILDGEHKDIWDAALDVLMRAKMDPGNKTASEFDPGNQQMTETINEVTQAQDSAFKDLEE